MTEIIAVVNQKGGVGKTTTAVNIATAFAAMQYKTLLIDADSQGNASSGVGFTANKRNNSVYEMIVGENGFTASISQTDIPYLSIIPASIDLSAADIDLVNHPRREFVLADLIRENNEFDYIVIDCPPSLGLLTVNALVAATSLIVPMQCEYYALEGLAHLLSTIERVQLNLNPDLKIMGILLTMYDKRNSLTKQVENDVREYLGSDVFNTVIPRNVRVSEAPSFGKPVIIYDLRCPGARSYLNLVREIIERAKNLHQGLYEEEKLLVDKG